MTLSTSVQPASAHLAGRTALIAGGSRGIGLAIGAELLGRGASVAVTGRTESDLRAAAETLARHCGDTGRILTIVSHAGRAEDRADAVERTIDRFGRLDILINNVGINPVYGPLMDADLDLVSKVMDLNVVAALGFVQQTYRAWMAEHGGVVVNMASIGGLRSTGTIAAYGASKAALIRLTEELAWELGPHIRVNAVAPAVIRTRFSEALYKGNEQETAASYPLKRLGEPGDVADLVAFLVSDEAAWITGETIRIDGGLLATGS